MYVAVDDTSCIAVFDTSGSLITQWGFHYSPGEYRPTPPPVPGGLALDDSGNVYVSDTAKNRVQKFLTLIDTPGFPLAVSVTGRGSVSRSIQKVRYAPGSAVLLAATPKLGDRFVSWAGDTASTSDTLTVIVGRPLDIVAIFEHDPSAAAALLGVSDVPVDQGAAAVVKWARGLIDEASLPGYACCYRIQRRLNSNPDDSWAEISQVTATAAPTYEQVVSTPADSTETDGAVFRYRVLLLASGDTAQWVSNEVEGHSVDNLAPSAPASVSGVIASGFASLSWPAVSASDIAQYAIYRGPEAVLPTDLAHRIGTTTATTFNDSPGYFVYYRVTALDVHGNESLGTLFVSFNPADVPGRPAPKVLSIGSPFPSPMAHSMSMTLGLPRAMSATVEVLDSQGRLVRRLCEGERPAGWVTLSWDARDSRGLASAAGMYFVRVQTPEGQSVRRLALIP